MRKFMNISFALGLVVWFLTAIYLSINSTIGIFVETNPNVSKTIFAISFIWMVGVGIYNYYVGGDFAHIVTDLQNMKKSREVKAEERKKGCSTCKKKK